MNCKIVRANIDDVWLKERGRWRPGIGPGARRTASISCPGCGQVQTLSGHDIAADGTVTPSVVCHYSDDCGFHEYITLEGWSEYLQEKLSN